MDIGQNLKLLRLKCGLTQLELADRCDLTKGYISQLENNLTSPSILTLSTMLSVLGSSLQDFFTTKENKVVFKKSEYLQKETDTHDTVWLIPNSQKNQMEPTLLTIHPQSSLMQDMPHEGEEFGYILTGTVSLTYGNQTYTIREGESFYFEADKPHTLTNNTNKKAVLIYISSPPTF